MSFARLEARLPGAHFKTTEVHISWNYISGGTTNQDELVLTQQLVQRLHELLTLCHVTETLTRSYHDEERLNRRTKKMELRAWTQGPSFAGLYWSTEQLVHAGDLLERHISELIDAEDSRAHLLGILHWLSPTESAVGHPLRHKKIYDLRTFAETAVGFPRIINYSWHELAADEFDLKVSPRYWASHFNYMDFAPWRAMVLDTNLNTKIPVLQEIREQILYKATTISRLLSRFRERASENFAQGSRYPEKTAALRTSRSLPTPIPWARPGTPILASTPPHPNLLRMPSSPPILLSVLESLLQVRRSRLQSCLMIASCSSFMDCPRTSR